MTNLQLIELSILITLSFTMGYIVIMSKNRFYDGLVQAVTVGGVYLYLINGTDISIYNEYVYLLNNNHSTFLENFILYLMIVLIVNSFIYMKISILTSFLVFSMVNFNLGQGGIGIEWFIVLYLMVSGLSSFFDSILGETPEIKD